MGKYQDGVNRVLKGRVVDRVEDRFGDGLILWFEDGGFIKFTNAIGFCTSCGDAITDNDVDYGLCEKIDK
jgi:hypothetical protein